MFLVFIKKNKFSFLKKYLKEKYLKKKYIINQ